jgi:hypothetical protein
VHTNLGRYAMETDFGGSSRATARAAATKFI